MAKRKDESQTNFVVGIFVVSLGALLLVSLFVIATNHGLLKRKTTITADFRTIAGLNDSSAVQLSGRAVGSVIGFEFTQRRYSCDPLTEDQGRVSQGRSDDCEPSLFCALDGGDGLCAELEPYIGTSVEYPRCSEKSPCREGTVCVDKAFRGRYQRLVWAGPEGICVPYKVQHGRISVTMEIDADKLPYIRSDSRATIQSNGVLGDKLVDISVGYNDPIPEGGRVQVSPSLMEELALFKDQLYSISGKVEQSLAGVQGLFDDLNNENSKQDLRELLANINVITRQVTEGEGVVAALLQEPEMRKDVADTLASLRGTAEGAERTMRSLSRDVAPAVRSVQKAADSASTVLDSVKDPSNRALVSRLFHDQELGKDVANTIDDASKTVKSASATLDNVDDIVADVRFSVKHGKGTLGKLIKDPKAYDDLVKLLGNIERMNVVKKLVRYAIEKDEASSAARPKGVR